MAEGEGQHFEFKESIPSKVRELSEEGCAFAKVTAEEMKKYFNESRTYARLKLHDLVILK